jgi:membrane-associated phospholipid phosphatase
VRRLGSAAVAFALAVALVAPPRAASADDADHDDELARPRRSVHVPLTIGLGVAYFLAEGPFKAPLSADTCTWCGPVLVDDGVRDALRWDATGQAYALSNLTGFVGAPLFALGSIGLAAHDDGRFGNWFDDGLIIAESAAIAGVLNFTVKALTARERPFVHQLAPEDKPRTPHPQDNNQSFYSGHSTLAMALAVSTGTVATMRGYDWAPFLWGGGVAIALSTGYLRIAADRHWSSDVLTGWATGAVIGYAVPRFLHRKDREVTPLISPTTVGVAVRW